MLLAETFQAHNKVRFVLEFGYFLPWKDQVAKVLERKGAVVHCFPASNNLLLFFKFFTLSRFFKKHHINIIHCHLPWAGFVGRVAGKLAGIPVVYTEHNKQERYHIITRWLNKLTFSWQKCVIAVSDEVAESIRKNIDSKTSVITVLNGVNTNTFVRIEDERRKFRQQLYIPDHCKVIGIVAVLRVQKRIELWLESAAEIVKQFPDTRFIIVGDGPCRLLAEQKIMEFELESYVHLVGLQTETRGYYAAFDLFFMTSEFEGLPVAMLEAMSMSCPVVSTTAGGIGEVVRHGIDGLLYPVNTSATMLASGCVQLLKDQQQAKEFGVHSRQRVMDAFSIERMVTKIELIYHDLTSQA